MQDRQVVADKSYRRAGKLVWLGERDIRRNPALRQDERTRRWGDRPDGWQEAVHENHRRTGCEKDKGGVARDGDRPGVNAIKLRFVRVHSIQAEV